MTDNAVRCEKCESTNLMFSKKRQLYICEDCGHEFQPAHRRRIFLGYGHDEHAYFAQRLHEDLTRAGYDIWFDVKKLTGGMDWEKFIEEGMEWVSEYPGEGRHILLVTPYSVRRPDGFCLNEISRAIQRGIPLIPVMVVTAQVPAAIRGLRWLDMRDCLPPDRKPDLYRARLEALIRVIEGEPREGDLETPDRSMAATATDASTPASSGSVRVYIGCAPEHRQLAGRLKEDLVSQGIEVYDGSGIDRSSPEYELAVEDGLSWTAEAQANGRFLLIMSPAAVRRPGGTCLNELSQAIVKKLTVVPVMASLCEPPLSICRVQWLDMRDSLPPETRPTRYAFRLHQLAGMLRTGKMDVEGIQSHLMRVLDPIPFDADVQSHVSRFVGRRQAIGRICDWLDDPAAPRALWLTGPPGSGKSAIAAWFAYNRPEVLALHICSAEDTQRSDPGKFILSIAYQLATQLPGLQPYYGTLSIEEMARSMSPAVLFDQLIVRPLREQVTHSGKRPALLVVDEADGAALATDLPGLLASEFEQTPPWLRLLIAGRAAPRLEASIRCLAPAIVDLAQFDATGDVKTYAYGRIARHYGPGSATDAAVERVAADSEGNMLYAGCAVDEIILGGMSPDSLRAFPRNLGAHYLRFFRRQFPDLDRYKARLRPVLEIICASEKPVDIKTIAALLDTGENDVIDACSDLYTLFPVKDGMIGPFHRSLVRWLIVRERSAQYFVSAARGRERLAGGLTPGTRVP
ncbi:MAG: hypothetical protein A4E28_02034 [Methanocella sp. PtaU1.Bin125]|nr:MAG: hypothetical protein A4E28_02034 [Methanocella sp. PtaU1.Bin125]